MQTKTKKGPEAEKETVLSDAALKPVVVTTEHRGVFVGYVRADADLTQRVIRIEKARMILKWVGIRGLTGLAATGPNDRCRVGPPAPAMTLQKVTAVMEASAEAAAAWEKAPWS